VRALATRFGEAHELLVWCAGAVTAAIGSEDLNDDEEDTLDAIRHYEKICKFLGYEASPDILAMVPGLELSLASYGGKHALKED
jgi:hypothetical protein